MTLNILDKVQDIMPHLTTAGSMAIGGAIGNTPVAGSILFVSATGTLAQDTGLTYDLTDQQLVLAAGTVGKPTLIWGDDTTGFYRPAANQLAVSISGVLAALFGAGTLPDSDQTLAVGRALIDERTTDRAHFSHRDMTGTAAHAVMQRSDGTTFLNAPTGQSIGLTIQNVNVISIEAAQITVSQRIKFVSGNEQTTVGAAGAASALPATPSKYFKFLDSAGTAYVIPGYLAA